MKKRVLSAFMALCLMLTMLPVSALAADEPEGGYSVGDTFTADSEDAKLPTNIPSGTEWSGPERTRGDLICGKQEHTHSLEDGCYKLICEHKHTDDCYPTEWVRCTREANPDHYERKEFLGYVWYEHKSSDTECENHRFGYVDRAWAYQVPDKTQDPICGHPSLEHEDCYELTCTKDEHTHGDQCYEMTYTWTLVYQNDSSDDWRAWWPVYWGFEDSSSVKNVNLVTVESGANTVTYANGEVRAQTALNDGDAANAGMLVSNGVQITVAPGYYLTGYRLVCGNYTGCGVATRSNNTNFTGGNYSSTVDYEVGTDRDSQDDMHINHGYNLSNNYPIQKPDSTKNNLYYGNNQIYPFYLLLKVAEDTNRYSVTYNWGELEDKLASYDVPGSDRNLKRNDNVLSKAPSDEAVTTALSLGYVFTGWKVEGSGYAGDALVDANHNLVITGNLTLTAQWKEAGTPDLADDDLEIRVTVKCTNQAATHSKPTDPYGLIEDTYFGSSTVNSDGDLEYTVTVNAEQYVAKYDTDTGETHTPTDGHDTVTYVYGDNGWEVKTGSSTSITFEVACTTQYKITVNYVDESGHSLRDAYETMQNAGTQYDVTEKIPDTITSDGKIYDKESVEGTTSGTLSSNVTITVKYKEHYVGSPSISVSKTLTSVERGGVTYTDDLAGMVVGQGDTLTWTIEVINNGDAAAEDLTLEDTLKAVNSDETEESRTLGSLETSDGTAVLPSYTFDVAKDGDTGDTVTFTAIYTVKASDAGKTLTNQASVGDITSGTTENPVGYAAGYFVLKPEKIDLTSFDFTSGGNADDYYPDSAGEQSSSNETGRVDSTTGYIGYITEAAKTALLTDANKTET